MWNDQEAKVDLLGHRRIAQTLIKIIEQESLRPLTIGIHGSWGAGKSSILSLVEEQVKDETNTLCLVFNGWLYQGYEDTKSALMESVVHELLKCRSTSQKINDLGKSILRRINWLKVAKTTGELAITTILGLPPTALLINLLQAIPAQELGTWTASNLSFIKSPSGQQARADFYAKVQRNEDASKPLKSLIGQLTAH